MNLGESNETCLGLSRGNPQGRGIGTGDAAKLYVSLQKSKAVKTGLVEDLEDCRIFIEGIDKDKISDMTTAIIRKQLIEYTQQQAKLNGIPLRKGTPSGFFWDILVPKGVVSFTTEYTPQEYYSNYVLEYHRNDLRTINPILVQHRKDGTPYVTKKTLKEEFPYSKAFLLKFTENHPDIFEKFKQQKKRAGQTSIGNSLSEADIPSLAKSMIKQLQQIPTGADNATSYHRLMAGIMELVFYPQLRYPRIEREINEGRKRIDITFDNTAQTGFYKDLHEIKKVSALYIMIECKNYTDDINNPELDQMAGRLANYRGRFGMIVCRNIKDINLFLKRCSDTWKAGNGLIIPLIDSDFISILDDIAKTTQGQNVKSERVEDILHQRCRNIILA
jgi:hypothetical protein